MRLTEQLARTRDKLAYALICDESALTADGTNRVFLHRELVDELNQIHGRMKSPDRKKWIHLAITVLTENGIRSPDLSEKEWCEMIRSAERYIKSAIGNIGHKVDHFL